MDCIGWVDKVQALILTFFLLDFKLLVKEDKTSCYKFKLLQLLFCQSRIKNFNLFLFEMPGFESRTYLVASQSATHWAIMTWFKTTFYWKSLYFLKFWFQSFFKILNLKLNLKCQSCWTRYNLKILSQSILQDSFQLKTNL